MKKFENKATEITEGTKELGFKELALVGLNAVPKEGWTTDTMRKRFKAIDKIEKLSKVGDKIELEDAEFDVLLEASKINWGMMHKDIVRFDDYLQELNSK
jgi:hypothetical protein